MAHFEIYAADVGAAMRFYGGLLGWAFSPMPGGEEVNYQLVSGDAFDGSLSAGILTRPDTAHKAGSAVRGGTMTFEVENVDDRYNWALANGGSEALPPNDMPGIGRFAYVEDGQGNIVGILTPAGNGE